MDRKRTGLILILIGVGLPLILALFTDYYSSRKGILENLKNMEIIIKEEKVAVAKAPTSYGSVDSHFGEDMSLEQLVEKHKEYPLPKERFVDLRIAKSILPYESENLSSREWLEKVHEIYYPTVEWEYYLQKMGDKYGWRDCYQYEQYIGPPLVDLRIVTSDAFSIPYRIVFALAVVLILLGIGMAILPKREK